MDTNQKPMGETSSPVESSQPSHSEARLRGWQRYSEKNYPEAITELQRALENDPQDIDATYALGLTYKEAGRKQDAIDTFRNVMNLVDQLDDPIRRRMIRRLATGHINEIESGDWNLEKEVWHRA